MNRSVARYWSTIRSDFTRSSKGLNLGAPGLGAPLIAEGRLVSLFEESLLPEEDGFYLFYPSRKQNPAALRALVSFLQTTPL
jgi:DNA-binding transcriptional LysR family regulator